MNALGFFRGVTVGDVIKSWDVLKTANFLRDRLPPETPVLDIGAYASEILSVLHRMKYSNLTGVDLNPRIKEMPFADHIRYEVADFMATPFPDGSFGAITAISVIEHGFQSERLLREISRLLRPGGYFIASFDYWPEKGGHDRHRHLRHGLENILESGSARLHRGSTCVRAFALR